eukprot:CFRG6360T1
MVLYCTLALAYLSLAVTTLVAQPLSVYNLYPKSLVTTIGSVTLPPTGIDALSVAFPGSEGKPIDQLANIENDSYFFHANGNIKGYSGLFLFHHQQLSQENITSMSIDTIWAGSQGDWAIWKFALRNFQTGQDDVILTNIHSLDWKWNKLSGNLSFPQYNGEYVDNNGDIHLRYSTEGPNGTFDSSFINFLMVNIHANEPRSSSSPTPSTSSLPKSVPTPGTTITHRVSPISLSTILGSVEVPAGGIQSLSYSSMPTPDEEKAYLFHSNNTSPKGYSGIFKFILPLVQRDNITSVSLKATWLGSDGTWNVWNFALIDFNTGAETPLANNMEVDDWKWSILQAQVAYPTVTGSHVNSDNEMHVRYYTDGPPPTYDDSLIDSLILTVKENEATPGSSPLPSPSPPPPVGTIIAHNVKPTSLITTIGTVDMPAGGLQGLEAPSSIIGKPLEQTPNVVNKACLFHSNNTNPKGYSGIFKFTLPNVRRDNVTSVSLNATWLGPEGIWNLWQFALINFKTGKQTLLASNMNAIDWKWSVIYGLKNFTYADGSYVNDAKEIHVRYYTNGPPTTFDDSFLASLLLTVRENEPRNPRPSALPRPLTPAPALPSRSPLAWTVGSRICGLSLSATTDSTVYLQSKIVNSKTEGCSVLEFDASLSIYSTDEQFANQVEFLSIASGIAKEQNLRTVIYIPSLEVNIPGGCHKDTGAPTDLSMTQDPVKSKWLQTNLEGQMNVFCGDKEVWVSDGMESAWFDPNNEEFRNWFLSRVTKLARNTHLDGLWADVPIYSDTAGSWFGAGPDSDRKFAKWSSEKGLNNGIGYTKCPTPADAVSKSKIFREWLMWRHETLADWQDSIRKAGEEGKSGFQAIAEVYPMDYMDPLWTGLDTDRRNASLLRVWEVDSTSNTKAMEFSTPEDFRVKIAMNKYARAADGETPSWVFSYGNKDLDAGMVMGAALASGCGVFECKTPSMTSTVGTEFRQRWMSWIGEMEGALFTDRRIANVGVVHSSATRDYYDFKMGGQYGMFLESTPTPSDDTDWWAVAGHSSSLLKMKHVGAYKGIMGALTKLQVSHKVVLDHTDGLQSLAGLQALFLPDVAALSNASATLIRQFVQNGGAVFASGVVPGTMDELGNERAGSVLSDIFGFETNTVSRTTSSVNNYGDGVAVFRPDITVRELFGGEPFPTPVSIAARINADDHIKRFVRTHVPETTIVKQLLPSGATAATTRIYLEVGEPSTDGSTQSLFLLNLEGVRQPIASAQMTVRVFYRAPPGSKVKTVGVHTPDQSSWAGEIYASRFNQQGSDFEERVESMLGLWYTMDISIDQFSVLVVYLEPLGNTFTSSSNIMTTPEWTKAVTDGMNFIKTRMRNLALPAPYKYGVFTNFKDITADQEDVVYANGHHTTAEHMGLFLRASACTGDSVAHDEGTEYVKNIMISPLVSVINWAVDKTTQKPLTQQLDVGSSRAVNGNAPLDDMRAIRGLIEGAGAFIDGALTAASAAEIALMGLYWTSVSDVMVYDSGDDDYTGVRVAQLPQYEGGVMGYSYDWSETEAHASGDGMLGVDLIPIDYSYLKTMSLAARFNPRWRNTLEAATQMLLDSEIQESPGLFYNGLSTESESQHQPYTGDFEYRNLAESNRGRHLKTIQTLWIAIHLAEAGSDNSNSLSAEMKTKARLAATRAYERFNSIYTTSGKRIPEYLTMDGKDVQTTGGQYPLLESENLWNGEARIYAQFARLANALGFLSTAVHIIDEKIITDQVQAGQLKGMIGVSTSSAGDAEAWNTLESVLTICTVGRA